MAKSSNLNKKKKVSIGTIVLYFFIAVAVILCLYPFLNMLAYSLSGYNAVLSGKVTLFPVDITLDAYRAVVKRPQLWLAMKTTIEVTLAGTALSLVLTVIAAYSLSRKNLPGRSILTGIIMFTMYFSGGTIPTFLIVKQVGLYDSLGSLFIPQAVNVFNFIVMRTFFRQLPEELEEAAKIDGASYMKVLIKIILPLSTAILATIGLFYAVGYWNTYFDALLYIQDPDKYTLQLRLRSLLFSSELNSSGTTVEENNIQVMGQSLKMACVVFSTVPILVVYPWLQKYFVKGMLLGSVKG